MTPNWKGCAAEAMGWEDFSTLEPGKLADLVVVDGDNLANIEASGDAV
jgi:imidazolonepropionase-like amidohydrolase